MQAGCQAGCGAVRGAVWGVGFWGVLVLGFWSCGFGEFWGFRECFFLAYCNVIVMSLLVKKNKKIVFGMDFPFGFAWVFLVIFLLGFSRAGFFMAFHLFVYYYVFC